MTPSLDRIDSKLDNLFEVCADNRERLARLESGLDSNMEHFSILIKDIENLEGRVSQLEKIRWQHMGVFIGVSATISMLISLLGAL